MTFFILLSYGAKQELFPLNRDDIEIKEPQNGVVKIVMKFGGSSLATAERITYVSK